MRACYAALSLMLASSIASAETPAPLQRLRGTIESVDASGLTLKTKDGKSVTVMLSAETKVAAVSPSNLESVKDGVFIGTATKGDNPPVALEVVVFPEAMRGTAEGHYDWDEITDTTAGSTAVSKSMMTNGTVKSAASAAGSTVKSAMTNGTIKSAASADGTKKLTVTYDNGKSIDIMVPATAPIVGLAPADTSILKVGGHVFIVAGVDGAKFSAKRVFAGLNGLIPPM